MTHPNPRFAWTDTAAMRRFVAEHAFAHLLIAVPAGIAAAHAPVVLAAEDAIEFHLARANRACRMIEGATLIASVAAQDCYVSPDWYVSADQVPTWNYVAVEAEGVVEPLDAAGLVAHLDALSAAQEARLAPKRAWTRGKMADGRFEAMLPGIRGYRLRVAAWRGTRKLGQNKPAADVAGVVAALGALGRDDLAGAVAVANGLAR